MRRLLLASLSLLLIPFVGCKPAGKALTSLQYHNIKWQLTKTTMTMCIGDGSVDARKLMENEVYVGCVTVGNVTVEYPQGLECAAKVLANQFNDFYPIVQSKLGIEWSFHPVLRLVRVNGMACGYHYSVNLPKNRRIVFPIPVVQGSPDAWWTPVVAHEMTEASMLAPLKSKKIILGDLYSGDYCIPMGTRWFRDGASDYAEYLFESSTKTPGCSYSAPGYVYQDLNKTKDCLLSWTNCQGEPDYYGAAAGLMFEMTNRFGDNAVAKMMCQVTKTSVPDGRGLKRAFKKTTEVDLGEYLKCYETPWAGFVTRDSSPDRTRPNCVLQGNKVEVTSVYQATPAYRRGILPGDIILSAAGERIMSANGLAHTIARQKPGDVVPFEIERRGEILPMKLKLIPRPVDVNEFLKLSGVSFAGAGF